MYLIWNRKWVPLFTSYLDFNSIKAVWTTSFFFNVCIFKLIDYIWMRNYQFQYSALTGSLIQQIFNLCQCLTYEALLYVSAIRMMFSCREKTTYRQFFFKLKYTLKAIWIKKHTISNPNIYITLSLTIFHFYLND